MPLPQKNLPCWAVLTGLISTLTGIAGGQTFNYSTVAGNAGDGSVDGPTNQARFYFPEGVAVDAAGNLYVADTLNSTIRRIDPGGLVITLAGTAGNSGNTNAIGAFAEFDDPQGIAVDGNTNIYIADTANSTIREITPAGNNWVVTTLAGLPGNLGSSNGIGSSALFNLPGAIAAYGETNLFVADTGNSTIRMLVPSGTNWIVTTLAGSAGTNGFLNGTNSHALFNQPAGIAVDANRNLYVADTGNAAIRKMTLAGTNWVTTTIAGNLNSPDSITLDAASHVYVTLGDNTIRRLTPSGTNWVLSTVAGISGVGGSADGTSQALFSYPHGITVASNDTLYVTDSLDNTVRKITANGVVTTWAGLAGGAGASDGSADQARFNAPLGLAVDAGTNIYVADSQNNLIRQITAAGIVTTLAGAAATLRGSTDGTGTSASFNLPVAVAMDSHSNLYVADYENNEIRKLTPSGGQWAVTTLAGHANANYAGMITNVVGGTSYQAMVFYYESNYVNYSGLITNIVNHATSVTVVAFTNNSVVIVTNVINGKTNAASIMLVSNLFELPAAPLLLNGTIPDVLFDHPSGLALDGADNLYVADGSTNGVRLITPDGTVTTLAGSAGFYSVDPARFGTNQFFYHSSGVVVDGTGDVYVADSANNTIREINPNGSVTTIAGSPGLYGDEDGTNAAARFAGPATLAMDAQTNLYVADSFNQVIRRIAPSGTNWVVTTVGGEPGVAGSADGIANAARFNHPGGVAADALGNLYIADTGNDTIRLGVNISETFPLQIAQAANQVIVSWPGSITGFTLETSSDLIHWTPVTNISGSEFVISNNASSAAAFFRLYKP